MAGIDAVLEAIKRVDGRIGGLEGRVEGVHETTGKLKVDVGVLGERVDNMSTRVDGLNGRVESAITTASQAKTIAGISGRRWGAIVGAIITGLAGIIVALIHLQGA